MNCGAEVNAALSLVEFVYVRPQFAVCGADGAWAFGHYQAPSSAVKVAE